MLCAGVEISYEVEGRASYARYLSNKLNKVREYRYLGEKCSETPPKQQIGSNFSPMGNCINENPVTPPKTPKRSKQAMVRPQERFVLIVFSNLASE